MTRIGRYARTTSETDVTVTVDLDGTGRRAIATGLGFLDHMLEAFALHARLDLDVMVRGDLHVDDHHTAEDAALGIGAAIDHALGDRSGIRRFGSALAPLDEALARCAIDFSGRGGAFIDLGLRRDRLGDIACENLTHFLQSLATSARMTLHVDLLRGANDHHRAEAAFKACALALRSAVELDPRPIMPSTKGAL